MSRRFTLAGLLLWVTFVALVLAIVAPLHRYSRRRETHADRVASVAASADGSRFAALFGDGQVRIWDQDGVLKTVLQTQGTFGADLLLSHDGQLVAIVPGPRDRHVYPRSREDIVIWDVPKETIWRTLPGPVISVAFSPTSTKSLVTVIDKPVASTSVNAGSYFGYVQQQGWGGSYEVHVLEGDNPPRMVGDGNAVAFSPDGKKVVVMNDRHSGDAIQIYASSGGQPEKAFSRGHRELPHCNHVAWAPDGQSIVAVYGNYGWKDSRRESVERFDLANNWNKLVVALGPDNDDDAVGLYRPTLLPGGRLAIGAPGRGYKALDSKTLEPLPSAEMADLWYVAAGIHGDTFIAAGRAKVDLWDARTLLPRKRLFEAAGPPSVNLPTCGGVVWLSLFVMHLRRKGQRRANGAGEDRDQQSANRLPPIALAERQASR